VAASAAASAKISAASGQQLSGGVKAKMAKMKMASAAWRHQAAAIIGINRNEGG
jgi:hypothetical protein